MKRLLLLICAIGFTTASASASMADADAIWARRGEGARGAQAEAAPIDAAITAYRAALERNPTNFEARWKLMRALRFKGAHVATTNEQKRQIYDQAKSVGEAGIEILDGMLRSKGISSIVNAPEREVAKLARSIPQAGEFLYWDSVSWGEWALVFGKIAAVRQGAADRIRRESTIAMYIGSSIEKGGGARVLGRLHHQTPRVPFLTGWASNAEAVKYLTQSLEEDPSSKLTRVFLAEAIVAHDKKRKPEAIRTLREVIETPADPAWAVEEAGAQEDARALLRQWGAE